VPDKGADGRSERERERESAEGPDGGSGRQIAKIEPRASFSPVAVPVLSLLALLGQSTKTDAEGAAGWESCEAATLSCCVSESTARHSAR
jgi:hypothetical protein